MFYAYCRRSTDQQNDTSFEVQSKHLKRQAELIGEKDFSIITETGSGSSIEGRPLFKKLLEDSTSGDIIGLYDSSRGFRNTEEALHAASVLNIKGVRLYISDKFMDVSNPIDKMLFSIQSSYDSYQREIQRKKSIEGMNQKRVNGDWVPASMFGYTIIHGKHPTVTINEEEARWVRYAFNSFINGSPYRQIALNIGRQLNKSIPTGRIIEWMRNPNYMGYYSLETVRHPQQRTEFYRKPKAEIEKSLIKSNHVPQIVDETIWWKAHEVEMDYRDNGNRQQYWNRHRTSFLLTGILCCEYCGVHARHVTRNNHGHHKEAYELTNHEPSCPNDNKVLDASILETLVKVSYFTTLLSYNNTAMFFSEEKERIERDTAELRKQIESIDELISQNKKTVQKYMELFEKDILDESDFSERMLTLKKEMKTYKEQKQSLESDIYIKEADITEILGELTSDRIQDFIHFDIRKKNLMIHSICDCFNISKDSIHISYRNGMSYDVKLNDKFKQWPEAIEINVFFRNELEYTISLDRDNLSVELDCEEETDIWKKSVNDYYRTIVDKCNELLKQDYDSEYVFS